MERLESEAAGGSLFRLARRILAGEAPALDTAVAEKQAEATRLLRLYALSDAVKDRFWANLDTTYFLRHDAQEIAWQTRNLHYRVDTQGTPVVRRPGWRRSAKACR